jgi:hypothetical protein
MTKISKFIFALALIASGFTMIEKVTVATSGDRPIIHGGESDPGP